MHFDNALNIAVLQIGKSGIVTEQEGHAGVIVLEVQRRTHSFRSLVHKAENALVAAAHLLVHQVGLKFQTQIIIFTLAHGNIAQLLRFVVEQQVKMDIRHIKAVVKNVDDGIFVDADKNITRLNIGLCGRTSGNNSGDLYCHASFPFFMESDSLSRKK